MASEEIDPRPHKYWPSVESLKAFGQKPTSDITICRLYQGLRFHTQREDGTNPTSIRPTKRNRSSNNDSLQKHQSESTFTRWRHRILRHCCMSITRDTLAPYLFIICLDYVLRRSIDKIRENGFELTKKRSKMYPAKTITDATYADDIALLANTPNQAETPLHSLERAAASIGLHVNAHETEYMCCNQTGDITTLDGTSLKLVDKFSYLGSSFSSTEKDIDTRLTKAWTAIDRLSIIWKSDLTDKMKRSFFQAAVVSILLYGCTTWTLTKWLKKKLDGNYTRMLRAILNKSWWQHPTRHQLYGQLPLITKTIQVRRTRHAGYCWRSKDGLISGVLLWTPAYGQAKAGRPARTYIQQLCEDRQKRWVIERSGERGSGISVLAAWHDDDDKCWAPTLAYWIGNSFILLS